MVCGRDSLQAFTSGSAPNASTAAAIFGHLASAAQAPSVLSKNSLMNTNMAASASDILVPTSQTDAPPSDASIFSMNSGIFVEKYSALVSSAVLAFWYMSLQSRMFSVMESMTAASTGDEPAMPTWDATKRSMVLDCGIMAPSYSRSGRRPSDAVSLPSALAASNSGRVMVLKSPGVPKLSGYRMSSYLVPVAANMYRVVSATPRASK
mmetsp:Transcript_23904/g.71720  ORF Transcript_23904/g.71720 Transcript_23904/m.71720 type:complete len:208 (-) Transcript_23904:90-713(-)